MTTNESVQVAQPEGGASAGRTEAARTRPRLFMPLAILAALALGAAVVAPYFFSRWQVTGGKKEYLLILTHDMTNHSFYMDQFQQGVRSGVLYPRWFADANNGYGIAVANYYPPGFYYATTLVNAVFNNWHTTLFALMALMMAGAGLAMYALARALFSRTASVGAALVYMLLPYHLIDLYWRGALPEIFGFIFLPLIFYFAFKAGDRGAARHIAGLGLTYGLYLLTHFPVGVMFSYALAFYALVWAARAKDWRILLRIAVGMGLGLAISAVYWLPAALEMKLVYEYTQDIFPYHLSYIQPIPNPDPFNWNIYSSLKLSAVLMVVVWSICRRRPGDSATGPAEHATATDGAATGVTEAARRLQISLWLLVGGASLFMTTAFSYDIGRWLPKIELTVPPFRWLAVGTLFGAMLAGAAIERLRKGEGFSPRQLLAWRVAFGLVIALNLWVTFSGVIGNALKNPTFSPPQSYVEASMTPRDATRPDQLPDTALVVIEPPGGKSNVVTWMPERREIQVQLEQPSRVRLRTYNFPGWAARVDGARVPMGSDADGIQVVEVPAGVHTIEVSFHNTTPRWAGTVIMWLGLFAVVGLTVTDRMRSRRQFPQATAQGAAAGAGRWVRYAVIAVTAIVAIALVWALVARLSRNKPPAAGSATEQRRTSIGAGSLATLYIGGQESVYVAADEQALPELLGALAAKDAAGVDRLLNSDRVLRLPNNTGVEVVEVAAGRLKVRLTEGKYAMRTGWVVDRWVR
ncbi:MAG TPA: 6-pyruvoyl-tetrahydropterin synthase-related protein [Blastocatellia bacterium]|nr:6-pyruvoyl-tetrahydropterin synthase-related protein [Blastocatellia bacterium]